MKKSMKSDTINCINEFLSRANLNFASKPIVIGGMAMQYYDIRKAGADIDLIITNDDYHKLAKLYPEQRKDLYGDLGLVIQNFEIWRSIAHLDYSFFQKDAIDEGNVYMVSIDRLLWTRVCAMDVPKYKKDLELMREYYYKTYTNQEYHAEAASHEKSYQELNGLVVGGRYLEETK